MKNKSDTANLSFLTGLLTGSLLAGGVSYLLLTKQGRKLSKTMIRLAEKYAEKGEELMENQKIEEKVNDLVDKLKSGMAESKKKLDIKK